MAYVVFSLDLGRCFTGPDDPAIVYGFETFDDALGFIKSDGWLCQSCINTVNEGHHPTDTTCYRLGVIWSERRLSRDLNGAWYREIRKKNRRYHDSNYKNRRKR